MEKQLEQPMEMPERITLQFLLKHNLPVWVRNATGDKGVSKDPGIISIQVGSGTNRGRVIIPPGNDPVCITDQVDPESLRSCRDLFALSRRGLEILDPNQAEEYYRNNEERRVVVEEGISNNLSNKKLDSLPEKYRKEQEKRAIHPKIEDMCVKSNHKIVHDQKFMETMHGIEKVLGVEDYKHVIMNCSSKVLQEWAQDRLEKIDPVEAAIV